VSAQSSAPGTFITRWHNVAVLPATELATAQSFVRDLCDLLGVPHPHPTEAQDYQFERPVTFAHGDGSESAGRIDCYKRGAFVLEAKKLKAPGSKSAFDAALLAARSQAEGYARALPATEGRPPFAIVIDVGRVIELYAEFTRSGGIYVPFPDPRSHRIALAEYAESLRDAWPDVPETSDFVMYWWHKAAGLTRAGHLRRFGLIITNSLKQVFSRKVIEHHMAAKPPLGLKYAIPDHPWVDASDGADVRISMTVAMLGSEAGTLAQVVDETPLEEGEIAVTLRPRDGRKSCCPGW